AAVVECDLVAFLDGLAGGDQDLVPAGVGLGVRPAGMVDVARLVAAGRAIHGPATVDFEQILGGELVGDPVGQLATRIIDDELAALDQPGGEQTEAAFRAADPVRTARPFCFSWHEANSLRWTSLNVPEPGVLSS